jgi:hypothetical protein
VRSIGARRRRAQCALCASRVKAPRSRLDEWRTMSAQPNREETETMGDKGPGSKSKDKKKKGAKKK